jgi:hypothetical protein
MAPAHNPPPHLALKSSSTAGDNLGLTTAVRRSLGGVFSAAGTNTIRFHANCEVTIFIGQAGSGVTPNTDAHTFADIYGNDVTANRMHNSYDFSLGAVANSTVSDSQALYSNTGASTTQLLFAKVYPGDTFTIADLTTGTLATTILNVSVGAHALPGRL